MNSTNEPSPDRRSKKAVLVAMILSLLALSASASAVPGDEARSGIDLAHTSYVTTHGRSWS